jgi:ankyrin repeat protein
MSKTDAIPALFADPNDPTVMDPTIIPNVNHYTHYMQEDILFPIENIPAVAFIYDYITQDGILNHTNLRGNTELHLFTMFNLIDFIKDILQAGVNPYIFNKEGKTPLDIAIETNNYEIAKLY